MLRLLCLLIFDNIFWERDGVGSWFRRAPLRGRIFDAPLGHTSIILYGVIVFQGFRFRGWIDIARVIAPLCEFPMG